MFYESTWSLFYKIVLLCADASRRTQRQKTLNQSAEVNGIKPRGRLNSVHLCNGTDARGFRRSKENFIKHGSMTTPISANGSKQNKEISARV